MSGWTIVWIVLLSLLGLLVLLLAVPIYPARHLPRGADGPGAGLGDPVPAVSAQEEAGKGEAPQGGKAQKEPQAKTGKAAERIHVGFPDAQGGRRGGGGFLLHLPGPAAVDRGETGSWRPSRWTIWISAWSWRRGDAAETAQNYGRVCALIFPAEALVESEIRVRRRKVRVMPDFLASKGEADLDIRLHAVPARITWSFFRLLFSFIFHQNTPAGSNVKEAGSHG